MIQAVRGLKVRNHHMLCCPIVPHYQRAIGPMQPTVELLFFKVINKILQNDLALIRIEARDSASDHFIHEDTFTAGHRMRSNHRMFHWRVILMNTDFYFRIFYTRRDGAEVADVDWIKVQLRENGTCRLRLFRFHFDPKGRIEGEGKWRIKGRDNLFEITDPGFAVNQALYLGRQDGELIIYDWHGDPDSFEFLKFRKADD